MNGKKWTLKSKWRGSPEKNVVSVKILRGCDELFLGMMDSKKLKSVTRKIIFQARKGGILCRQAGRYFFC